MTTITNERPSQQETIIAQGNAIAQVLSQHPHGQLMKVSTTTYVNSLTTAAISMKYAVGLEISTALIAFAEHNGTTRSAKRFLMNLYALAGYSVDPGKSDYKTCARRVHGASLVYDRLGSEKVMEMIGGAAEGMAISNLANALEPLGITSYDAAFLFGGRPRLPAKPATAPVQIETKQPQPIAETPPEAAKAPEGAQPSLEEGEIVLEPSARGEHAEEPEEAMPKYTRRATDVGTKQVAANAQDFIQGLGDYVEIGTEHVSIRLSHDADKSEILKAALQLMEIADEMEAKQAQEKAETDSVLAIKLMEEMRKMTTGKKAPSATEGGLEPMKPAKGRRLVR